MLAGTDALTTGFLQRRPPALVALLVQALAWGATFILLSLAGDLTSPAPMPWPILAQGLLAWGIAGWLGQPAWWQLIHLLFFPAVWLTGQAHLNPAWFLAGLVILALTSIGVLRTRVPLYLSSRQAVARLAELLPGTNGKHLADLGCGLGGPLANLAALRPDLVLHGVEAAPLNWLVSRLRLGRKASVRLGSIWDEDLGRYDAVYAYLSPAPMARLWDKARREMRPGALFISNSFAIPGVEPDQIIELDDLTRARLLVWRMA
ncbi:MAG TPA: class I SAM-dependent methyltransferase [Thiobacillaceae bacterium]|nr:class I SAM-dependent methyltransferase [Thiobacillaceae bacterium]